MFINFLKRLLGFNQEPVSQEYIIEQLERARDHAVEKQINIGDSFKLRLDTPKGTSNPQKLVEAIQMSPLTTDYGLMAGHGWYDEVEFTRLT